MTRRFVAFIYCSPLVASVVSDEVAMVTVIFSLSFLSSPHVSLTVFSINNLQLLLFLLFSIFLPIFSDLLTQSSRFIFSLPRLLFPSTFWAPVLCQFLISRSSHMSDPFQPTPHQFLPKTFLHSNLHSQFVHSSLIRSLHSHDSSFPVVLTNQHLLLFLC